MTRLSPIKPDFSRLRTHSPATFIHRAASAHLRSFVTGGIAATDAAKAMFGDDGATELVLKAASAPATTTTSGWAQSLAGIAVYDLVQSITSLSAGADVIDRVLKLNMDGIAEARVPGRVLNAAAAGQWVAEGAAVPVRALSFTNAAILRPRKLSMISTYSREMVESSNIEAVVRATLGEAVGLALDAQMFSSTAGDATKPPGLFAGVSPIAATTGGGTNAMITDLGNLFAALAAASAGKTAVIVAAMPQAVKLKLTAGPKFATTSWLQPRWQLEPWLYWSLRPLSPDLAPWRSSARPRLRPCIWKQMLQSISLVARQAWQCR